MKAIDEEISNMKETIVRQLSGVPEPEGLECSFRRLFAAFEEALPCISSYDAMLGKQAKLKVLARLKGE